MPSIESLRAAMAAAPARPEPIPSLADLLRARLGAYGILADSTPVPSLAVSMLGRAALGDDLGPLRQAAARLDIAFESLVQHPTLAVTVLQAERMRAQVPAPVLSARERLQQFQAQAQERADTQSDLIEAHFRVLYPPLPQPEPRRESTINTAAQIISSRCRCCR